MSGEDEPKIFSKENNFFEILEEGQKVDIVKYIDYMSAFQAGAIETFSCSTKDTFNGKTVSDLRFLLRTICTFLHLGDGFDACKFLINELKASVPIRKKEVYANVEIWKRILSFGNKVFLIRRMYFLR
ncbi:unnamed protein product [Brassica rapa]|uniref:Uncharacterized protein n=1 Tax=Brassica campestris TaxID=3711 RepID=A0A8D9D5M3_BRACM|nr:unnamed protein product [Brassica rapa]